MFQVLHLHAIETISIILTGRYFAVLLVSSRISEKRTCLLGMCGSLN